MFETLKELNKLKVEYDKKIKKEGLKAIKTAFKEFFDKHGEEVSTIIVTGSVPSFNDGDPCVFNLGDPRFILIKPDEEESEEFSESKEDESEEDEEEFDDDDYDEEDGVDFWDIHDKNYKFEKDASKIFDLLDEELMESVFGSGFKLTITAGGIDQEEYYEEY
jgi:hypothetical protein